MYALAVKIKNLLSTKNIKTQDDAERIVRRGIYVHAAIALYIFVYTALYFGELRHYLADLPGIYELVSLFYFRFRLVTNFPSAMVAFSLILLVGLKPFRYFRKAVILLKVDKCARKKYLLGRTLSLVDMAIYGAFLALIFVPIIALLVIWVFIGLGS